MDDRKLEDLIVILSERSGEELISIISEEMLGLSKEDIIMTQFAFWFCHIVEKDLDTILKLSFQNMESVYGKTPDELYDFIRIAYKINLEIIDQSHPEYDPSNITFNSRIDIAEKLHGISEHTVFLKKVKGIRNDLSHLRIDNLKYEDNSLLDDSIKAKMVSDYIALSMNMRDLKSEGGVTINPTDNEMARIERDWNKWKSAKGK